MFGCEPLCKMRSTWIGFRHLRAHGTWAATRALDGLSASETTSDRLDSDSRTLDRIPAFCILPTHRIRSLLYRRSNYGGLAMRLAHPGPFVEGTPC